MRGCQRRSFVYSVRETCSPPLPVLPSPAAPRPAPSRLSWGQQLAVPLRRCSGSRGGTRTAVPRHPAALAHSIRGAGALDSPVKLVSRSAPSLRGGCGGKRSGTRTGGVGGAVSVVELLPKIGVGGWLLFRSCSRLMREGRLLCRCYPGSVGGAVVFSALPPGRWRGGGTFAV